MWIVIEQLSIFVPVRWLFTTRSWFVSKNEVSY